MEQQPPSDGPPQLPPIDSLSIAPTPLPKDKVYQAQPPTPPPHTPTTTFKEQQQQEPKESLPVPQQPQQLQVPTSTTLSLTKTSPSRRSTLTPPSTRSSSVFDVGGAGSEQLLDHSHLKPGANASLLSYNQTINMYRENAKKTNNPDVQCDFAIFMVEAAKPLTTDQDEETRWEYLSEAEKLLKQLSSRGHAESQYYLGNLYASGILSRKGKNEFDKAFPLFVQATKHHHADAAFRAAKCYEDALGCRRDNSKAVQFYRFVCNSKKRCHYISLANRHQTIFRKAATLNHPAAMYRLGIAEVNGDLGISKNPRNGVKWLKRASEAATPEYPHAVHELALLHEKGIDNVVFVDLDYAVSLFAQAADLGYAPSAYRLGECYEYGKLNCPQDPALSIHYYTLAAEQGHREACFALTAWYLVGSPGVLPQSDEQAYVWAKRAADKELPKAEYALGYFSECGIGTVRNTEEAMQWYKKAAEHGDTRAIQRLQGKPNPPPKQKKQRFGSGDDQCIVM